MSQFFYPQVNDWGETVYLPTIMGYVLLMVILILLIVAASVLAKVAGKKYKPVDEKAEQSTASSKPKSAVALTTKQMVFCAMSIALATLLSELKLYHFPTGGSITLFSMLLIALPGYLFGLGTGIISGIAYGILQLVIDPYILFPAQLVVDYILAFGAIGISGLFWQSKNGLLKGYIAGILGRYFFAVLSGWIFFGTYAWEGWAPLPYSLVYNAIYIFSEGLITVLLLCLPPVKNAFQTIRSFAHN